MPGERHLHQRDEQAAVGAVVVGEQQPRGAQLRERRGELQQAAGLVEIGGLVAQLAVHLRERRAAQAVPAARPGRPATGSLRRSCSCSAGVSVRPASVTGANADTTSETGAMTHFSAPSASRQSVRIDSESLPTGMAMPSCGHSSFATARTVAYSAASSPRSPHAAIQLADRRICDSAAMSAASTLVIASATARRPEAGASSSATGLRSPMAIASPAHALVVGERHRHVAHRHLPRSHQLIAADETADGAIADGDEKGLVGHRRQAQHAVRGLAQDQRAGVEWPRRARRRSPPCASGAAACRAAPRAAYRPGRCRTAGRTP